MQWVFIALIVVIVSILVSVLQKVMVAVKKSYYIPPSEAVIDQSMPQEILEHIFSFMAPLTLLQSHNVSKYWRSHASKNRIKTMVLERYVNSIQRELPGIENHRLNYHESYPIDRRLKDIALAQKRGRDLLEMNAPNSSWPELVDLRTRYAIKFVTQIGYTSFPYLFNMGGKYVSMSNVTKKETESVIASYEGSIDLSAKYEVMVTLEDYCSTNANANFIMCRNTKEPTKRFGIIPLDKSFLPAMIFLMIPLVVHDALYSEFLSVIKQWFGPIAFLVLNGITVQENLDVLSYYANKRNVRLYKNSSHFAFIGIFVGATLYGYALYDQHFGEHWYQPKSKEKLQFFLICATLVLLMNDWSMTIQSFIDGAIWQRLFWNMIHALFFTLYAIWISTMSAILHDDHKAWDWRFLINYDKQSVILISSFSISAVFVTLYAPYWEVGLLVFIVAILISALRKVTNSVISRRYVPPSDAIIDQIMPEEILEHIFSFTDPLTFQQCLNVSRYWRSHASKTPVKKLVVERYVNSVRNSDFVKHRIEVFKDNVWIDYPENYSIDARLQDMAFAEKRGKRLLELNLAPDNSYILAAINDSQNTSHIIKSPATLANNTPKFRIGGRVLAMAEVQNVPPVLTIKEDGMVDQAVKYEVMLNLDEYCKTDLHKVNIFMIRNLTEKKNRFGFVPIDESFLSALAFLVIPLIVHDVLYSEPFMNVLKLLAGPLSCGILTTVIARDNFDSESNLRTFQNAKLFRTLVISTIVALAIGFLLFYPVSSTHWAFIGIVIGVSAYAWMLFEYVYGQNFEIQTKHTRTLLLARAKERKQIMYVCFGLLLLMVDWPVTIQSVIDGRFWYRLLWNTIHYLVFVSYAIWNNFMACVLQDSQKKFRWSYFYDWERSLVEQFAYFYGSVVYVTLCAPNWQGNGN